MTVTAFIAAAPARAASPKRRCIDRFELAGHQFVAFLVLLAASPLLVAITLLVWHAGGSPIFFGHYRVGRDGRLFRCLKFRTMHVDAEEALARLLAADAAARAEWQRDQKLARDPRITPIGRILRKTSLDELPQLINVLRGDMCFVGPRPVTPAELMRYGSVRWHYVSVTPGITGLWQVSGRNRTTYDQRVALDMQYVETRNLWRDLVILARTVRVVLTGHGAA
jgi:lipopolysaccharide/colanic/teichoic acid biosynthesis glycosyltransferase